MFVTIKTLFVALSLVPAVFAKALPACTDDATYTFGTYSWQSSTTTRDCAWITANADPDRTARRRSNWCLQTVNGSRVADKCPAACDMCPVVCTNSDTYTFGTYLWQGATTTRDCAWITQNPNKKAKRQGDWCSQTVGGSVVGDECPLACDKCPACVDTTLEFRVEQTRRDCAWVAADSATRCSATGVSAACPVTCGTCNLCADPDLAFRFKFNYNGIDVRRTCNHIKRIPGKVWGRCEASDNICRKTCGKC